MAKKNNILYTDLQRYVKDKDVSVSAYVDMFLNKLQAMFVYNNVPETIDIQAMERALMVSGNIAIVKVGNDLYALTGSTGGEMNAYYQYTQYIIANPYLQLNKTYTIGDDCVLVRNDYEMCGLMPIIGKYAVLLTDSEISLNTVSVLTRISMLISASDDKTKASAELFVSKILNGDFSVIGESAFLDGIRLQTVPHSSSNDMTQLIELLQYYKASFYNEIGLNANYNMKRERLTVNELNVNIDALLPLADEMLSERQKAMTQVNEKFGTNITVDFGSAWKTIHEEEEANTEHVNNEGGHGEEATEVTEVTEGEETTEETEVTEETEETEETEKEPIDEPEDKKDGNEEV